MTIKHFIGIGISISFVILSSILGYKFYQGISAEDIALATKISFFTIFVLLLLFIGATATFCIYYFAQRSTMSTISKNINVNEKTQEMASEIAKKALDTTIAISNHSPTVKLSLPTKINELDGTKEESSNVIKLHQWEKG